VTLGRVARELAVELPLLRAHFAGEDELLSSLAGDAAAEQARCLDSAAPDLLSQARAYRRFALEHPAQYRLITEWPLQRDGSRPRPPRAFDQLPVELARAAWAFAHGMVELELDGRLPPATDVEAVWRAGIAALTAAPIAGAIGRTSALRVNAG
jgi:AcrR family transcriptional regulator